MLLFRTLTQTTVLSSTVNISQFMSRLCGTLRTGEQRMGLPLRGATTVANCILSYTTNERAPGYNVILAVEQD